MMIDEPKTGNEIDGFVVKAVTPLLEMRMTAYQLVHIETGARVLHLHADDDENLFSVSIPTPPHDNTGVPHILEHSVLSGSEKYPVRDPFFEMVKMSMATFINAMTGWDCTFYPVASNVKQDLFNLADVYFDAVFHPLLTEDTFKREGHHLAPAKKEDPAGELTVNGIVYNEMKGVFSNPESKLYYGLSQGLFSGPPYGYNSGGLPENIPDLTYADFRRFHQLHYHPGNAFFVLYGNIPTREYLTFLGSRLSGFGGSQFTLDLTMQPRWTAPRSITEQYPVPQGEPLAAKTYIGLNWLVGNAADAMEAARFYVLSLLLLGNEAAPLKKAIIDSKLGEDIVFGGYGSVGLEATFGVGIKGSEPHLSDRFISLVMDALSAVADGPVDDGAIAAAFQQAGYAHLEIHSGHPLHLMNRVLASWMCGGPPLSFLAMNDCLEACRLEFGKDRRFFGRMIREKLLHNPHRLGYVLQPDPGWQARTDEAFASRMSELRAGLSDERVRAIAADEERLDALSATPNPPEAVAKLPQLRVCDLPRTPRHIPSTIVRLNGGREMLMNDVLANGVCYLQLNFCLDGLPAGLWPYVPHYADAIHKLGAAGGNYELIARRVSAHTGGIGCWPSLQTHASGPGRFLRSIRLSLKTIDREIEPALDVLRDLLFAVDPGADMHRLQDVLIQAESECRTRIVIDPDTSTAASHAACGMTPQAYLGDLLHGRPQLAMNGRMLAHFESEGPDMAAKIAQIRDFLLIRSRVTASFTGSDHSAGVVTEVLNGWISVMRPESVLDAPFGFAGHGIPPRDGLAAPIAVAHCAQVMPAPYASDPDSPLVSIGAHLISSDYMLPEVRLKGNAYGASCNYDTMGGMLTLGSFSDPNITATLNVFNGVTDYVRRAAWTQTDIDHAIIGVTKGSERPIRPEEATGQALGRHLAGQTREWRQNRHTRLLSATLRDVKNTMRATLESALPHSAVCVVAGRKKLEEANVELKTGSLNILHIDPAMAKNG